MADKVMEFEDEGRYGWGTQAAVATLFKKLGESKRQETALVLVNLDTMVRNTADGKLTIDEVVNKVCSYMTNIATDFAAVVGEWKSLTHTIVFYHAQNNRVVWEPVRRVTKSAAGLSAQEAMVKLLKRLETAKEQKVGNVRSIVAIGNSLRQPSYKGLAELCGKLTPSEVTINIISHNPIDWHIGYLGRKCLLYRSYTGTCIEMTPKNLGPIVFDNPNVPFTPVTHVLLGDKSVIKGFLKGTDKDNFLKAASHEKFIVRTEGFIIDRAKINLGLLPYRL